VCCVVPSSGNIKENAMKTTDFGKLLTGVAAATVVAFGFAYADLSDTFCHGIAIGLGNNEGF
jgi:hypothetical protein